MAEVCSTHGGMKIHKEIKRPLVSSRRNGTMKLEVILS
jgi:hypothetical protein